MKKYINMYGDELDDLYVVNGQRVYPIKKGIIQDDDNNSSAEGTYEEHYEVHDEYCIHERRLVNQGLTMCDINQDITMCCSCPYRKPRTTRVKVSSASTN